MDYRILGKSGLKVSELCFGSLTMGPLQANMPVDDGAKVILEALNSGVNFIDTAQVYQTYPYIKKALSQFSGEVIIASKSYATRYDEMKEAVHEACCQLERDYIDIFLLHAAKEDKRVFEKRADALSCLMDLKKEGIIRAIGISTHAIEVVEKAADVPEIDIVFPLINQKGLGIIGGTPEDMILAIHKVHQHGKGIYAMKALAGGYLINQILEAIQFIRGITAIQSIAIGMNHVRELKTNLKIFNNEEINVDELAAEGLKRKKLFVSRFCEGCGTCIEHCPNSALSLAGSRVEVDEGLCLTCGYCVPHCPIFALRII